MGKIFPEKYISKTLHSKTKLVYNLTPFRQQKTLSAKQFHVKGIIYILKPSILSFWFKITAVIQVITKRKPALNNQNNDQKCSSNFLNRISSTAVLCGTVCLNYCEEVRYACTVRVFCNDTGRYTLVRCLNLRSKRTKRTVPIGTVRFICNVRPSVKICATVHIQLKIHDVAPVARPVFVSRLYLI